MCLALLTSDEASGFAGYYGESDLVYLYSFDSLVIGKVAVLLIAVVKVDSTRVAFVIVALTLEVVRLVTGTRRGLSSEPFTGRPLTLTAGRRV